MSMSSPLDEPLNSALKWAADHSEREEKLRTMVLRMARELDDLIRQ